MAQRQKVGILPIVSVWRARIVVAAAYSLGGRGRGGRELEGHFQRSRFRGDDDLVFDQPLPGSVLDPSKLRKRFIAAALLAGLRRVRFHDLRHTFGTRMAAAGAPLRAVQEWMGHSDYRTTSIYTDYAPDQTQRRPLRSACLRVARGSCTPRCSRRGLHPRRRTEPIVLSSSKG